MEPWWEYLKLLRYFDAITLFREGYWGCINCTAHNLNSQPICIVCGAECWIRNMPTELLSLGPLITMTQNVVYALPAVRARLFTNTALAAFDISNDPTFTTDVSPTLAADGSLEVSGGFIRSTAGNALVTLKRA